MKQNAITHKHEIDVTSQGILILGDHNHHGLETTLATLGFSTMLWSSALHSLEKLKTYPVRAVVIDRDVAHADVLEFILNVRDINAHIPIVVVAHHKQDHTDEAMRQQSQVTYIKASPQDTQLSNTLSQLLTSTQIE